MPAALPKKSKKNQQPKAPTSSLVKRIIRTYVARYKTELFIAILFMAFAAAMTAALAALMQPVLDDVLYGKREDLIIPVALGICLTFCGRGVSTYIHTILMNKVGQNIVADIQTDLFEKFMHLDMAFFHANPSGQLVSRVVNDVNIMRYAVTDSLTGLGKSLFTLIFLIGLMFLTDWKLTLAAFIVFPLLSGFVIYVGKRLRKVSKSIQSELGDLSDLLSQTFQGIRLIMAYRAEHFEIAKVTRAIYRVRDLNIKSVRISTLLTPVNEILVGFIFAGIIIYGGYEVIAGRTTAGHLASFIAAFTMAYEPMKKLAKLNNTLQTGLGAADRVFFMIDTKSQILDSDGAQIITSKTPDVIFDNIEFSYAGEDLRALQNISFTARNGRVTALVGPSGGGKSTIMNLIPRFYDPSNGSVKVDGVDIRRISQASLRENIALVSQDITIFNDSVMANIRYGNLNASDKAVFEAAKAAAAHDFILGFDHGYETIVGENGTKLSGGQKQRISIARAILRDAPILLLDEATSALDNESEKLVQDALKILEKGRTTIVIAHRLTTVQEADQILVLDQGHIAEQGTHNALLAQNGIYAQMYKTGMKG